MAASPAEALLGSSRGRRSDPAIDGVRGAAVLILFTSAVWRISGKPDLELSLGIGHLSLSPFFAMSEAVEWFIVLSAYLVARPFVAAAIVGRSRPAMWPYLRRRAARLYPALWLVLVLFATVMTPWLATEASVYSGGGLQALVATATGLGSLFPWSFGRWFVLSPLRTVTHHVLVYLVVPPLAFWLARRRTARAIAGTLCVSLVVSVGWWWAIRSSVGADVARAFGRAAGLGGEVDPRDVGRIMLLDQFPAYAPDVALGIGLALIAERARRVPAVAARLAAASRTLLIVGCAVTFGAMWAMGSIATERGFITDAFAQVTDHSGGATLYHLGRHALLGLGFSLVLASVVLGSRRARIANHRWLRCVGVVGFGVYLVHGPVLYSQSWLPWLADMEPNARFVAAWIVGAATTAMFALVMWFGLERRVLSRVRQRPSTAAPPMAPATSADARPGIVDRWLLGQAERGSRSLTQLDGIRGVAVLLVLLTHAWSFSGTPTYRVAGLQFGNLFSAAASGVTLFFVLSGFLLSRRFLERHHDGLGRGPLLPYFRDRAVRILPLYWLLVAVLLLVMVPWITAPDTAYSGAGLAALVPFVAVLSTMFSWSWGRWFVITPVWTLTVEVMFYAVIPFVAARFGRGGWRRALAAALGVTWLWLAVLRWSSMRPLVEAWGSIGEVALPGVAFGRIVLSAQLPTFAFAFAVGISIAAVDLERRRAGLASAPRSWYRWLVPGGAVCSLLMMWYVGGLQVDHGFADSFRTVMSTSGRGLSAYYLAPVLEAASFGLVIAGLVLDGRPHRIMRSSPLRAVGVLGYGIYLWHFPVMFSQSWLQWLREIRPALRLPVTFALGASVTVVLSVLTWFAVERSAMAWNRRRSAGPPLATTAPVTTALVAIAPATIAPMAIGDMTDSPEHDATASVPASVMASAVLEAADEAPPLDQVEQLDLFTTPTVTTDDAGDLVPDDASVSDATGRRSGGSAMRRRARRSSSRPDVTRERGG